MILTQITIKNFRCIDSLLFNIEPIDGGNTYTLLGINESGKSSFLKAISLIDNGEADFPQDFFDDQKPIELCLKYKMSDTNIKDFKIDLFDIYKFDKSIIQEIDIEEIKVTVLCPPALNSAKQEIVDAKFKKSIFSNYTLIDEIAVKKEKNVLPQDDLDLRSYFNKNLQNYFWDLSHKITFWKSSPKYLLLDEIDLEIFSNSPKSISLPLYNCFELSGIKDIKKQVAKLTSPVARQNLSDLLSESVTKHINKVWPEHLISIKFNINNYKLTFLVEDNDVKFQSKTINQRSDGFKQFISFLLTLSAENLNDKLSNAILLLDEPETHLHPSAQLNLKDELIKISKNSNNNIVFFATHSNYMIDKDQIDRCYKVIKKKNHTTIFEKIERTHSSYAEVNYEVFGVLTTDYHNELYGFIEDDDKSKLNALPKIKKWYNEKKKQEEDVSLCTYVRHSIHHPENTSNKKFTDAELKSSIKTLRNFKYP